MILNANPQQKTMRELRALYEKTFPRSEKKPFFVIRRKQRKGTMEILSVEDANGDFLGFAITILHKDIVLLDYFAISPTCRGQGIGTKVLALLEERYAGKRILLEIEDPDEPADNTAERLRRREFYLRNGLTIQDYKVWLFGVKMLILTNRSTVTFEEYHEIFEQVFSLKLSKNVTKA